MISTEKEDYFELEQQDLAGMLSDQNQGDRVGQWQEHWPS